MVLYWKNQINRNIGSTDSVAREFGEYFHRDKLDVHMCKYVYDEECVCPDSMEVETMIDCRDVRTTSYNLVGGIIAGDPKIRMGSYVWLNDQLSYNNLN